MPDEKVPEQRKRFARGVWDDDPLGEVPLGGGVLSPSLKLSLEPMELGLCTEKPFENQPSWAERMLALRDAPRLAPCASPTGKLSSAPPMSVPLIKTTSPSSNEPLHPPPRLHA